MHPKPEGYGDDFTTKCGHCNEIQVNGIHALKGNSVEILALVMKKTMTYCGKCTDFLMFRIETTPSNHCTN